jgi:hypothetical protein
VKRRKRSELVATDTELNAMAAPASIGLSKTPKNGYSAPAAVGALVLGYHRRVEAHRIEHLSGVAG